MAFPYVVPYVCRYCKYFGALTHTSKKSFLYMNYCCTHGTLFKIIFLSHNRVFFKKIQKKTICMGFPLDLQHFLLKNKVLTKCAFWLLLLFNTEIQ